MSTIYFYEHSYVLHNNPATLEISEEDFQKLENKEITMEDITNKYSNINYKGYSKPIYDDTYVHGYEYLGDEERSGMKSKNEEYFKNFQKMIDDSIKEKLKEIELEISNN